MPYTGNREFKANPRLMVSAKGAYYTDMHGKQVFDGLSGLWCTGLGHGRDEITRAVAQQMGTLTIRPRSSLGTRCRSSWPTPSSNACLRG